MIGTENLEEKLSQVLNDPNSMAQLMSFAQSLGMGPPDAPPPPGPPPGPSPGPPPGDDAFVRGILQLVRQANQKDGPQEALLAALKPYLRPDRREKLDRAMLAALKPYRAHLADRRQRAEAARRPAGRAERCITVIPQRPAGNTNASPSRSRSVRPAHRRGSRVPPVRRLRRSRRDRRRVLPRRPVRRAHRCGCRFWRG